MLTLSTAGVAQTTAFHIKAQKLLGTFGVYHFHPLTPTESHSREVVDLFIRDLDSRGMILKAGDVAQLRAKAPSFLSQVCAGDDSYVEGANTVYLKALASVDSILTLLSKKTLNFTEKDTSYFLPQSVALFYSPTMAYHAKRIERYVKFKSYDRVTNTEEYTTLGEAEFNARAQGFSKAVISHFQKNIAQELRNTYRLVEASLLNALAQRHDPHSNYFTQEQNQEFNSQLSYQSESFGFFLEENEDGLISIGHIEPGGSAWMSNEVNEGDIFISVKLGHERLAGDELDAATIQDKLDNTKENKMVLTVKKQNGLTKMVKLIKQKAASVDNSVKGYVLSASHLKVGYISLPSFYTDMEEHNLPGCANDVAKEILKLENDSIQGLIIDLRNNGGGSMLEAINLAGIFIDEGPLFIIRDKNKKPYLVKDINRGSIFKKRIVVMINEASASASELFANIVKDYNLGLVVGQTSYGKGTAQSVLPLDTNLQNGRNAAALKNNADFIKITNSRFYRLNGATHQGSGIRPDITLPPTPGYSIYKENKEPYFLIPDSVVKKVVFAPNKAIDLGPLQSKSAQRLAASPDFKRYATVSDSISAYINTTQKVALNYKDYKKFKAGAEVLYNSFENALEGRATTITCLNNTFDLKLEQVNEQTREFNTKILQSIQKDIFINESFYILNDLIQQQP